MRLALVPVAALIGLLVGPTAAAAPAPTAPAAVTVSSRPLHTLTELSARRLATADLVAAAKWGTGSPIDDPVREEQVLRAVRAQAEQLGADPVETARIFRDQIEANKNVQRSLHRRWTRHPEQAPVERPDLAVVRQEINRLNDGLVRSIAGSIPARTAPSCPAHLSVAAVQVSYERKLDHPHRAALTRAVRSVCRR